MKNLFWFIEDFFWGVRCSYNLWLHGPYGLSKVVEKIPFRFLVKYLRKYGATIGNNCRFERGLNLHRPMGKKPFENLFIGDDVYLGHNTLIDLSRKVEIKDKVIMASRCQIWTHASHFEGNDKKSYVYSENYGNVLIDEGAMIYSNVVIVHNVIIGRYSKIGASSLINKTIPSHEFWAGVPVKRIR